MTATSHDLRAILRALYLFRGWTEDDLERIVRISHPLERRQGDTLFMQEDDCRALHVLTQGRVQMFRIAPDGRDITLHELRPPELVGCAALFLEGRFPAGARVVSPTAELIAIEGQPFLKLLEERPRLSRAMIAALAMRLSAVAGRLESLAAQSSPARVANWLMDQPSQEGAGGHRQVRIEGSKKTLAATLGMTPETFSRALRQLSEESLIAVDRSRITLLNIDRLLELSEG